MQTGRVQTAVDFEYTLCVKISWKKLFGQTGSLLLDETYGFDYKNILKLTKQKARNSLAGLFSGVQ